ncbi:MAG: hypothetical protein ACTSU5_05070, partial [Promethearchaeota archaeon]
MRKFNFSLNRTSVEGIGVWTRARLLTSRWRPRGERRSGREAVWVPARFPSKSRGIPRTRGVPSAPPPTTRHAAPVPRAWADLGATLPDLETRRGAKYIRPGGQPYRKEARPNWSEATNDERR